MIRRLALAGALAPMVLASVAFAQSAQVPNPANPFPVNPIATDGTPLPSQAAVGSPYGTRGALYSGRSVGFEAPGVLAPVGGIVDGGLGLAGTAIDGVGATAGAVIGGTLGR